MTLPRLIRLEEATPLPALKAEACALVIGNFDGVHRGHQAVLAQAVALARVDEPLAVCALTFDPHPAQVLGSGAQPLLTSLEDRVELMGKAGVERVYARRFDLAFASWSPQRFAAELVTDWLRARIVVVGENFRFGVRRTGDLSLLRNMGREHGFIVQVADVASDGRGPYSSTRARDAVVSGDLDEVRRVLGRPHAVTGVVVHGNARGRTIGFPTANLGGVTELLPPNGVYAVTVDRRDEREPRYERIARGLANLGVRPTIGGDQQVLEAHLLDVSGELYGAHLRVHFVAKLRDEKKFTSLDELKAHIAQDVVHGRALLEREALGADAAGRA
jgi:riboflavin kinase/FMN adenylyltransferase